MARTIESAGVEINERDLSLVASLPVGTNIFVQGFAPVGPTDELINVQAFQNLNRFTEPQILQQKDTFIIHHAEY